jgi:hypothetical protein
MTMVIMNNDNYSDVYRCDNYDNDGNVCAKKNHKDNNYDDDDDDDDSDEVQPSFIFCIRCVSSEYSSNTICGISI